MQSVYENLPPYPLDLGLEAATGVQRKICVQGLADGGVEPLFANRKAPLDHIRPVLLRRFDERSAEGTRRLVW